LESVDFFSKKSDTKNPGSRSGERSGGPHSEKV
jgi:hypothetical protein